LAIAKEYLNPFDMRRYQNNPLYSPRLSQSRLKKADIIDDIVDDFMPKCFVAPFYDKKKKEYPVALGNTLKPSKTKDSPSLKIYCPEIQSTPGLTIILTDPDAPSRKDPKWSEMCHWISIVPTEEQYPFEIALSDVKNEVVECK
jgi:hypothetical protein